MEATIISPKHTKKSKQSVLLWLICFVPQHRSLQFIDKLLVPLLYSLLLCFPCQGRFLARHHWSSVHVRPKETACLLLRPASPSVSFWLLKEEEGALLYPVTHDNQEVLLIYAYFWFNLRSGIRWSISVKKIKMKVRKKTRLPDSNKLQILL